jgi:hypothetical protein
MIFSPKRRGRKPGHEILKRAQLSSLATAIGTLSQTGIGHSRRSTERHRVLQP